MIKRLLPLLIIIFSWLIFSKPFFLDNKIPFPTDFQLNNYTFWNSYEEFWGPVKNPSMPDVIDQIMPWKKLTIDTLKNFDVPLWNSYSFSGTPHLANYQSAVFSVTNIFYFLFDFNTAWGIAVIIQPLLAGLFMYIFTKSLKLSSQASLIASLTFMFSGFMVVWMNWTTLSLALSFLPLILFGIEKFYQTKQRRYIFISSLALTLSLFSGHFQTSLYVLITSLAFIIFKLFETKERPTTLLSILFIILGFTAASIQLIPTIEFYINAPRSEIFQKLEAVPLSHLPTIIAPDFYGNPVTRNDLSGHYIEWNGFVGVIAFFLFFFALFKRSPKIIFFTITTGVSLILALDSPVSSLIVNLKIPVISTSALSRILSIFIFSISVLSAFGFDELSKLIDERKIKTILKRVLPPLIIFLLIWIAALNLDEDKFSIAKRNMLLPSVLFTGAILVVILSLAKKARLKIILSLMVLLALFDLLRFATKWQPYNPKEHTFVNTDIINKLNSLDKNYRILGPFGGEGIYYRFPSSEGYDPLYIKTYGEYISSFNNGEIGELGRLGVKISQNSEFFPNTIDPLGIRYIVQKKSDINKPWEFPFGNFPKNKFQKIYEDQKFLIYENPEAFPKGTFVKTLNQKNSIRDLLSEPIKKEASAKVNTYSINNELNFSVKSDNLGYLFVNENYYPGWQALVNNSKSEILKTNYTFKAVQIPPGKSEVLLKYNPQSFRVGIMITTISLIILLFLARGKWYTNSNARRS